MKPVKVQLDQAKVKYVDILHLTRNRTLELDESSKEDDQSNLEWRLLRDLEDTLWKLTKLEAR